MKTRKLVLTGLFISITIILQGGFLPLSQAFVGPAVNFMLILTTLIVGVHYGVLAGLITPIIAYALGIIPNIIVIPFVMIGNALLVILFGMLMHKRISTTLAGLIVGALIKFGFLALSARYIFQFFMDPVPEPLVVAFTFPQLFNALIGGFIALTLYQALPEHIKIEENQQT